MVIINEELQGFEVLGYFQCIIGSIFGVFGSNAMGPIIMLVGITMLTFIMFRGKNQDITAGIILVVASALMLILEYFLIPPQNTAFYILLLTMSSGIILTFYYSLKPQNPPSKQVKVLSWTGSFVFAVSLFILMGIIFNNLTLSLIMGVATIIMLVTSWLIRRSIPHDDKSSDELDEGFTTENSEKYWLKYEVGGFPKPVRWQGWLCLVVLFSSPFVVIIFTRNVETAMVIVLAIITAAMVVIMLKSNYREIMREYRENLKK
jgi:hypothetical protein